MGKHMIRRGAHWRECVIEDAMGCLIWQGWTNRDGYGVRGGGKRRHPAGYYVHRQVYWDEVGPIPDGLTIDHLCRTKRCINPGHLEPVPINENIRRNPDHQMHRTHCVNGHPFDEVNTYHYVDSNGRPHRNCRACNRELKRRRLGLT